MIKIPKIIHQTWKNNELPEDFKRFSQSWKDMLPDWEYILWTDEMNREFVKEHYPHFLEKFDSFPNNIQRADVIRYLLLQKFGGLYVDLDFECLKPSFITLLENSEFVIGKEPYSNAKLNKMKYIICNALMASVPNHPFINYIIDKITNNKIDNDVLSTTGPFMITNSYKEYKQQENIKVLEPELIYPIGIGEAKYIFSNNTPKTMQNKIDDAYAIHYFYGTWW